MVTIKGQGVCGGVAFGKLYVLKKTSNVIKRERVDDTEAELARFEDARKKTMLRLGALYDKAVAEVGESSAMIFEIHRMMLEDEDYISSIRSIITNQKLNAETAVANTSDNFAEIFTAMDDSYMQARAADVRDISERLIGVLSDSATDEIHSDIPVILAAEDLAPSETVQLDKSKIMAIVTEKGSANSHTAILARTLNIPAVIGAKGITDNGESTDDVIVDGFTGTVYISPDMNTVLAMQKKKDEADSKKKLLNKLKGVKPVTKDGQSILLYANIGNPGDLPQAYANDAQGVGLFRSEFIYLERNSYPTEDEQFAVYKKSAEKMGGKRIIIRTLDIGADKQADYFELPREENPAMGVRAIRICLTRPQLFKTQLRALYRASAYGNIAIMFPMITSVNEVKRIKEICSEVRDELKAEKIPFNENTSLGIMIETPAAALISDKLADEADFFSIGTNDLTQYTLAVDRQNRAAEQFCDTHHLSVLRLIKTVVDNAHKSGIWAGICGELGADTSLTEMFLAMGVDELSVSPGAILPIKKKVLETDVSAVRDELLAKLN